jgi:hypothetical protein
MANNREISRKLLSLVQMSIIILGRTESFCVFEKMS